VPIYFLPTQQPVTAPVARNIGIRQSTGLYLAFIDADCIAEPHWLEFLLRAQFGGHSVVGGAVSLEATPYWRLCYNITMFHEFLDSASVGERKNMGTLNFCVSREVVDKVGLMDERLARGQDTEWTLRMRHHGYSLHFVPDAVIKHRPAVASLSKILRTWYRSGFFNASVRQVYRELISPPPFYQWPLVLRLLSPVIGFGVTLRIFARNPKLWRYLHTFPVIFLSKVAWCLGATQHADPLDSKLKR
jgi:GT2 family glycosyltransferase